MAPHGTSALTVTVRRQLCPALIGTSFSSRGLHSLSLPTQLTFLSVTLDQAVRPSCLSSFRQPSDAGRGCSQPSTLRLKGAK